MCPIYSYISFVRFYSAFNVHLPSFCAATTRAKLSSLEHGEMSQDEAQAIVYNEKMKEYKFEKQKFKVFAPELYF